MRLAFLPTLSAAISVLAACTGATQQQQSPEPTFQVPAAAPQAAPAPSKGQTVERVGEATVLTRESAVMVKGESLDVGLVDQISEIAGVARVTGYLVVPAQPHDIIGVDVEGELRVVTLPGEPEAQVIVGRRFRPEDEGTPVMMAGRNVAQDDYNGAPGAMTGMRHALSIGASVPVTEGSRVRFIGYFATGFAGGDDKVFLPLKTAQELFGRGNQVTHLYISVESSGQVNQVAAAIKSLLAGP